jgi:hypothetical protein
MRLLSRSSPSLLFRDERVVATINYAFEPSKPPFDDEPQVFLDPINPQSDKSEVLVGVFEKLITSDRGYHDRLVRHYALWKSVVDDPAHPDHRKVRSREHGNPAFRPAFPRQAPIGQTGRKIGPNELCRVAAAVRDVSMLQRER